VRFSFILRLSCLPLNVLLTTSPLLLQELHAALVGIIHLRVHIAGFVAVHASKQQHVYRWHNDRAAQSSKRIGEAPLEDVLRASAPTRQRLFEPSVARLIAPALEGGVQFEVCEVTVDLFPRNGVLG
jgi:hypothetical protein